MRPYVATSIQRGRNSQRMPIPGAPPPRNIDDWLILPHYATDKFSRFHSHARDKDASHWRRVQLFRFCAINLCVWGRPKRSGVVALTVEYWINLWECSMLYKFFYPFHEDIHMDSLNYSHCVEFVQTIKYRLSLMLILQRWSLSLESGYLYF